ncbi:MAG: hypothetical protein AAFW95_01745 [Cyanobacteria bacterium J06638_6]
MMTEAKQPEAWVEQDIGAIASRTVAQPLLDLRDQPLPDILRVLAIGSPPVVNNCVMTLYRLGYARPEEWSRQLPTVNPGEVMRILTKRIMATE